MKSIFHKVTLLIVIIIVMLQISACWDNKPLTERAIVMGIGIDKVENDMIEVTLQVVKPTSISYRDNNSSGDTVWVYSTKAETVFKAMRKQLQTINRKPFYSHVQLIIIGEKLATGGIKEVTDIFERDKEPRLSPNILIAKGTSAKEILSAKSELERVPAMHLMEILVNDKNNFSIYNITFIDLIRSLRYPEQNPTVGVIEIIDQQKDLNIADFKIRGGGVFSKDKVVGWLDEEGIEGLGYVLNKSNNGIIEIDNFFKKHNLVVIEQKRSETKIEIKFRNEQLIYVVKVEAEGNIGGEQGEEDLTKDNTIEKLEEEIEKSIEKKINIVINLGQRKYKSDIFGFGEKLNKKYPKYWEEIKNNWSEEFSKIQIEVEVNFEIRNSGLINKPTKIE